MWCWCFYVKWYEWKSGVKCKLIYIDINVTSCVMHLEFWIASVLDCVICEPTCWNHGTALLSMRKLITEKKNVCVYVHTHTQSRAIKSHSPFYRSSAVEFVLSPDSSPLLKLSMMVALACRTWRPMCMCLEQACDPHICRHTCRSPCSNWLM